MRNKLAFTVSMENQTLKSVINWVEKNSQFIFIYRTDIDLSRRVNVDVRNKTNRGGTETNVCRVLIWNIISVTDK